MAGCRDVSAGYKRDDVDASIWRSLEGSKTPASEGLRFLKSLFRWKFP
jgi:hypothetical protein